MRVLIKGYYGQDNLGDEAILFSILSWAARQRISAIVSVGDRRERLPEIVAATGANTEFIDRGLRSELRALRHVDSLLIGGGGLFPSDRPGLPLRLLLLSALGALMGKPTAMIGIGVNPVRNPVSRFAWKLLARCCRTIAVRDEASRLALENVLGHTLSARKVSRCSDVVLSLDPGLFQATTPSGGGRMLAVALAHPWDETELATPEGQRRYDVLVAGLADCIRQTSAAGWRVKIVPFFLPNDRIFAQDVLGQDGIAGAEIIADESVLGRLSVLAQSDAVLTMRFHGLVFGTLFSKPLAIISYDHKMEQLAKDLGIANDMVRLGIRESEFYGSVSDVDFAALSDILARVREAGGEVGYQQAREELVALSGRNFDVVGSALNI